MKKATKAILFSLGGTALGLIAAAIGKAMSHYKFYKQAGVMDLIKEMYPDENWDKRNLFLHLKGFDLKLYATDEFLAANPDAEAKIMSAVLEKAPCLEKLRCVIKVLPVSELKTRCGKGVMFECRKDEEPEHPETEEES